MVRTSEVLKHIDNRLDWMDSLIEHDLNVVEKPSDDDPPYPVEAMLVDLSDLVRGLRQDIAVRMRDFAEDDEEAAVKEPGFVHELEVAVKRASSATADLQALVEDLR